MALALVACSQAQKPAPVTPTPAAATTSATAPVQPAPSPAPDLAGDWSWTTDLGGQTMLGALQLVRSGTTYSGSATPEGATPATLTSLEINGRRVRMVFLTPDGTEAILELTLETNARMTGTVSYGGQSGSFTVTRR